VARTKLSPLSSRAYERRRHELWIELVALQKHVIAEGVKLLVILEGRDAAGKDGTIKTVTRHLSPRETRVVALGKPSDRDRQSWYFQRWAGQLPASGEFVLFNRSWYNRAGVERVMGFCTRREVKLFFEQAPILEDMLVRDGLVIAKYYLDISRAEQRERLKERREDPLSQWKISPIDAAALKHWKDYSKARDEMLASTHTDVAPWSIVHANDKRHARLELIRDLLSRVDYRGARDELRVPDPRVVERYSPDSAKRLAP
jgi:polyphosphate kinase